MIPAFDAQGNLPPGVHDASWQEFVDVFGRTKRRRLLLLGLSEAVKSLKRAGCRKLYLDGSFTTNKEAIYGEPPGDFDGCWEPQGVNPTLLDPVLLDFSNKRAAQKAKFGGELFISNYPAAPDGTAFLDFFQMDKRTGASKGIIVLNIVRLDEADLTYTPPLDEEESTAVSQVSKGVSFLSSVLLHFDQRGEKNSPSSPVSSIPTKGKRP